jgi:hypothetical protein
MTTPEDAARAANYTEAERIAMMSVCGEWRSRPLEQR